MRKLSKEFVKNYADKAPPWGPVGYITYKRTYARRKDDGKSEEWYETIERCINGALKIGVGFTQDEAERLYDHIFNLRCSLSGRALWQLGTKTVERIGGDSLQNCWCVAIDNPIKPFCFTFNELMLGGGVGFNMQAEHVYALPKLRHKVSIERCDDNDCDFIVPDNREGWVTLLGKVLKAYYFTGKDFRYSTTCIRPRGRLISTFGGIASGSEELVLGIQRISEILTRRYNEKLRPIDCLDIMNVIGSIVVAGNVRRSAEIALGDPGDTKFLAAKNWSKYSIPDWRAMSNNSVVVSNPNHLSENFWATYEGQGEPYGLVNLKACREQGRLGNPIPDRHIVGINPCGELPLESGEACNLAEIFLPNIKSIDQWRDVTILLYKVAKAIAQLPFTYKDTTEIVKRNQRLGIGISGYQQCKYVGHDKVFNSIYETLREYDGNYSKKIGANKSIKLTTVKPSGTLSLLPGVTPGIHPAYAHYYIRRIRMSANDPLVETCREAGYHIEPQYSFDGTTNPEVMVVSFPVATPQKTTCASSMTAIDQLETQRWIQRNWSDNSVSITVYYREKELDDIKAWLAKNYETDVKSCSFLLHKEHGFTQAPLEAITPKKFTEMVESTKPITRIVEKPDGVDHHLIGNTECDSGACPVK
jgi:ribonucleotide reductase alpha subunit